MEYKTGKRDILLAATLHVCRKIRKLYCEREALAVGSKIIFKLILIKGRLVLGKSRYARVETGFRRRRLFCER